VNRYYQCENCYKTETPVKVEGFDSPWHEIKVNGKKLYFCSTKCRANKIYSAPEPPPTPAGKPREEE
jgi:YHS domain-containing protein